MSDERRAEVVSLHQGELHSGHVANLADLTAEQAATVLMEAFQRTGYAEAMVSDLDRTRSLVRRDCRRRRLKVQTIGVGSRIVVMDETRHEHWLETPDGQAYRQRTERAIMDAMSAVLPKGPKKPPLRPLRS